MALATRYRADGTSDYVFDMPGGYSGSLSITVKYSDAAEASATITVASFQPDAEPDGSRAQPVHHHLRQRLQR